MEEYKEAFIIYYLFIFKNNNTHNIEDHKVNYLDLKKNKYHHFKT